jgi:hypothetical protein
MNWMARQACISLGIAAALIAAPASAQSVGQKLDEAAQKLEGTAEKVGEKAGETAEMVGQTAGKVVRQPAKDFGLQHTNIPPILMEAAADPYDLAGLSTCQALSSEVSRLNGVLGADYDVTPDGKDDTARHLVNAGGQAALSAVIPFRGLIREASGAAAEQRALNAAIDAGYARRGFLRGVHRTRNCRTTFEIQAAEK